MIDPRQLLLNELALLEEDARTLKRACFDNGHQAAHVALSNAESSVREAIALVEAKP